VTTAEGLDGHWPANQESLYLVTLQQPQLAELLLALDTLGDDLELQCVRQIDDDRDQGHSIRARHHGAHE
jgi:hypothetical protein